MEGKMFLRNFGISLEHAVSIFAFEVQSLNYRDESMFLRNVSILVSLQHAVSVLVVEVQLFNSEDG
jgi:hypothetical protein